MAFCVGEILCLIGTDMPCQRCQEIGTGLSCCCVEIIPVSGSVGVDISSQRRDEVGSRLNAMHVWAVRHACRRSLIKERV